jgi:hypothetical protein
MPNFAYQRRHHHGGVLIVLFPNSVRYAMIFRSRFFLIKCWERPRFPHKDTDNSLLTLRDRIIFGKLEVAQLLQRFNTLFSPPLVPILSKLNPVYTLPHFLFKIHYNSTFPFLPRSSMWPALFTFSNLNCLCISHSSHARCMPYLSNPPWFEEFYLLGYNAV